MPLPCLAALLALSFAAASAQGQAQPDLLPALGAAPGLGAYPLDAAEAGEEGAVYLQVQVDRQGAPTGVSISRAPSERLGAAAAAAMEAAPFQPARRGRQAVEAVVPITVRYRLEEGPSPEAPRTRVVEVDPYLTGGIWGLHTLVRYPAEALRRGEWGAVMVRVEVSETGRPLSATIVQNSTRSLEAEAIRVVMASRFVPGLRNGEPAAMPVTVPVRFTLRR